MTYIEFFDKNAVENISACLISTPDRVIFLGDNAKIMKKYIAILTQRNKLNRDIPYTKRSVPF